MSQQALSLGGPFHDAPYPALSPADFAPGTRYQVTLRNGARSVIIGDLEDAAIQHAASMIQPGPGAVDGILPGSSIMKPLRPVVNVREIPPLYSHSRSQLPSLRSYLSPQTAPDELSLLSYLGQGVVCGIFHDKGLLYDVLQPGRAIEASSILPNVLLTDGVWLWPGALLYYVREYHLRPPPEFVQHAETHHWRIDPAAIHTEELELDTFDRADPAPAG